MELLQKSLLLIFMVIVLTIPAKVKIFVKLQSLQIKGNDNLCDPGLISSACDLYLKVCLRETFAKHGCELYIVTPRRSFVDQNYIHFDKNIGHIENPISVELLKFPFSPELIIEVHDADFTLFDQDDTIATFRLNNFTVSTIPTASVNETSGSTAISAEDIPAIVLSQPTRERATVELTFSIWAQCIPPFYGPKCDSKCFPNDSMEHGHYGCSSVTGSKICLSGWRGENCSQIDICTTKKPCGLMGKCINTNDGFRCECQAPFKGPFCTVLPNECRTIEGPADMGQKFPFCLNNAFCMFNSDMENDKESDGRKMPLCICRPGFIGTRCERDVDECALWSGMEVQSFDSNATNFFKLSQSHGVVPCFTPGHVARPCCGPKAQCVNTYGSYKCICPPGWTGPHCEYPPVLWPDGYEPLKNRTDEVPLPERVGFYLGLFSPDAESAPDAGGQTTVWAYAFIGILVVFLFILLLVIFYLLVLRHRRNVLEPKYKPPSVRYERQTTTYGLPRTSTPASSVRHNLSQSGPYVSHTFRSVLPSRPKCIDRSSMERERTDYERLCDRLGSQREDLSTTYDILDEDSNEHHLSGVQSMMNPIEASYQDTSDRIPSAQVQTQPVTANDPTSTVCSNMLYLGPHAFTQADDVDGVTQLDRDV